MPTSEQREVGAVATAAVSVVALVLAAGALITAARSDGGATTVPARTAGSDAPASVAVELSEFAIAPDAIEVAVGGTLEVTNAGAAEHDLEVIGTQAATSMLGGGQSESLALDELAPGTYDIHCTVPGHEEAGMTGTLTTVGDGDTDADADATPAADSGEHTSGDDIDWASLDQAMHDSITAFPAETEGRGNQPLEPAEVLDDGTKVFRLVAEIIDWEVEPGKIVEGWAYNGQIPGPLIKVDVGDRVRVEVENRLPLGTDVHWHGVRVPNEQDGLAPLTQPLIGSGDEYTYEFVAEERAVGMYHPHHHGQMKLPNGMFGIFQIGDVDLPTGRTVSGIDIPEDLEVSQEIPMVLNDAGTIGLSLNGKSWPATEPIVAEQGEWILLHYYNEGMQIHPMHLHQMPQLVVAKDGFALDSPRWEDTVNVAPGERYSVLIQAKDPGVWAFHCHILNHAERDEGMFGMVTALIVE